MTPVSSSFFRSGRDVAFDPSTESSIQPASHKSSSESLHGRRSDQLLSAHSIGLSKSDHVAASMRHNANSVRRLGASSSDGRYSSDQQTSDSTVVSLKSENYANLSSSGRLVRHSGAGSSNPDGDVDQISGMCQSIESTAFSPSDEHAHSRRSSSNTSGRKSQTMWMCLDRKSTMSVDSEEYIKTSSPKSSQSKSIAHAKSNSGIKIKWCFRKSKSSTSEDRHEDGLRSPPELAPSPPELPDDVRRPLFPAGEEIGSCILLPSYYG
ncbi:uncharacterized protein [Amphiura filiformis]|uniref:uncharacterized protein n=1 Tax=Amphiura filiformis TaxID=82378 RepID=UPI003B215C93